MMPDDFPHLILAVRKGSYSGDQIAVSARHLLPVGKVAGAGDVAGIDCIAYHDVQAFFSGGSTEAPIQQMSMMHKNEQETVIYMVYPESRKHCALRMVRRTCSSTPSSPSLARSPPFPLE